MRVLDVVVDLEQLTIGFAIVDFLHDVSLPCERTIVVSTRQNEEVCLLLIIITRLFLKILVNELQLNVYGLIHKLKRVVEHILLQVNASEVVHATAELLTVLELVEDLGDFVVVQ